VRQKEEFDRRYWQMTRITQISFLLVGFRAYFVSNIIIFLTPFADIVILSVVDADRKTSAALVAEIPISVALGRVRPFDLSKPG
jgi:hypothetical protein